MLFCDGLLTASGRPMHMSSKNYRYKVQCTSRPGSTHAMRGCAVHNRSIDVIVLVLCSASYTGKVRQNHISYRSFYITYIPSRGA